MRVWITKHALTQGIQVTEGLATQFPDVIKTKENAHFSLPEWHVDEISARLRAELKRQKRIASLKRQITKLEELKF